MIKEILYKLFRMELPPPCGMCEIYRQQLEIANLEKKQLLDSILHKNIPVQQTDTTELTPILPRHTPWKVRQNMLEAEDRNQAQKLRAKQKEIDDIKVKELEKELEIPASGE